MIMSGYDFLQSQVLSCWRKVESVCDVVISSGRVFQTRGPATVNARGHRLLNVWQMAPSDDWCHLQSVVSVGRADRQQERRYRGALPCKTLYVSTATL